MCYIGHTITYITHYTRAKSVFHLDSHLFQCWYGTLKCPGLAGLIGTKTKTSHGEQQHRLCTDLRSGHPECWISDHVSEIVSTLELVLWEDVALVHWHHQATGLRGVAMFSVGLRYRAAAHIEFLIALLTFRSEVKAVCLTPALLLTLPPPFSLAGCLWWCPCFCSIIQDFFLSLFLSTTCKYKCYYGL